MAVIHCVCGRCGDATSTMKVDLMGYTYLCLRCIADLKRLFPDVLKSPHPNLVQKNDRNRV